MVLLEAHEVAKARRIDRRQPADPVELDNGVVRRVAGERLLEVVAVGSRAEAGSKALRQARSCKPPRRGGGRAEALESYLLAALEIDRDPSLEVDGDEPRLGPGEAGALHAGELHQPNLGSIWSASRAAIASEEVAAGEGALRRKKV